MQITRQALVTLIYQGVNLAIGDAQKITRLNNMV